MTNNANPSGMTQAPSTIGTSAGYMPGFGNDFETEALPCPTDCGNIDNINVQRYPAPSKILNHK